VGSTFFLTINIGGICHENYIQPFAYGELISKNYQDTNVVIVNNVRISIIIKGDPHMIENKKMPNRLILLILLICSCENPVEVVDKPVLYPISIGNSWKYISYTYSSRGEILPGLTDSLVMTIDEEILVNIEGKNYRGGVQTRRFGENTYAKARWIYGNLNNGLYYLGGISEKDTIFQKFLYLKYPVSQGEIWEVPYMYYHLINQRFEFKPSSTLRYTCKATNERINTEIGEFRCLVYHFRQKPEEDVAENWDYYLYYSPGVGLIGVEIRGDLVNDLKYKIVLVDYNIK